MEVFELKTIFHSNMKLRKVIPINFIKNGPEEYVGYFYVENLIIKFKWHSLAKSYLSQVGGVARSNIFD